MNNTFSDEFEIKKGVVQGSPLSALIFIIGLEPLLTTAVNNPIYGYFKIFSYEIFVLGYCDDLFMMTDNEGLLNWMRLLYKWQTIAGGKLKYIKCLLNLIGEQNPAIFNAVTTTMASNFQQNGEVWNIKTNEKFKLLCTKYDPTITGAKLASYTDSTWRSPASKLDFAFSIFYGSSNIFDRIIQTKSKLISLFISTESSAPSDLFQQKQIQRLINGATISPGSAKTPKIRSDINALPVLLGGLNVPLFSAISSAIAIKDLLRQLEKSIGWQTEIIRRDILLCFDSNSTFNNDTRDLPRLQIASAPINYLSSNNVKF